MVSLFIFLFVSALVFFTHNSVKGDSEFVGSEVCKDCHEAQYINFMKSIHGKKAIPGAPINRDGANRAMAPVPSTSKRAGEEA